MTDGKMQCWLWKEMEESGSEVRPWREGERKEREKE